MVRSHVIPLRTLCNDLAVSCVPLQVTASGGTRVHSGPAPSALEKHFTVCLKVSYFSLATFLLSFGYEFVHAYTRISVHTHHVCTMWHVFRSKDNLQEMDCSSHHVVFSLGDKYLYLSLFVAHEEIALLSPVCVHYVIIPER